MANHLAGPALAEAKSSQNRATKTTLLPELLVRILSEFKNTKTEWELVMPNTIDPPVAKAQMLIRKPVEQVFEALVNPEITSHFWFSKSSRPLEVGQRVRWDWEMYGHHTTVDVKAIEPNKRILIEWNGPNNPSFVEWTFEGTNENGTLVHVKNWGFASEANKAVSEAIISTGGFSFMLAAMKIFLEHGIEPNLVLDHDPDALVGTWRSKRAA
jgi:uncharacterized protein YndB with AHSA1/START domain